MARSLNADESEVFKNALSPERKVALEYGFEGLLQRRDEELELTPESAVWFGDQSTGATNS
jgi:hypothetical protein